MDLNQKDYLVIVQCHIVKERCPGYLCEKAFYERTGGFADYRQDTVIDDKSEHRRAEGVYENN
jgi:hypothetical protein